MHFNSDWYDLVPKVELHIHLEGAIPHDALWELMQKYGGDSQIKSREKLGEKFTYRNFANFLNTWIWKNSFIREYEDFTFIAEAVAGDLLNQNIRYAEVFFSPPDFHRYNLETQRIAEAIRAGLKKIQGVEITLVPDLVRDFGPKKAALTLEEIIEIKNLGIIGIGIGGSEKEFPPELFTSVFQRAREYGLFTSIHAGETAGSESIWGAIRALKPDRIGHGTRAYEDETLLEFLVKSQIPLEMCPISNIRTGVIPSIDQHPIRRYFDRGIAVTVNTDDPKMFGSSLAVEYKNLVDYLGFSINDIHSIILQGVRGSWLPEGKKNKLIFEFQNDPSWLVEI